MAKAEQDDVYDTIEWTAHQPWSSGRVGMIGESYYAIPMWLAAADKPPHLTTIVVYDGAVDMYRDALYHGGVLSVGFLNWWHTNTRALTLFDPVERLTVAAPENQAAFDFIGRCFAIRPTTSSGGNEPPWIGSLTSKSRSIRLQTGTRLAYTLASSQKRQAAGESTDRSFWAK